MSRLESPANSNERGTVKVKNNDPFEHPIIDPNSLSHPQDLVDMVKIRVHIKIGLPRYW